MKLDHLKPLNCSPKGNTCIPKHGYDWGKPMEQCLTTPCGRRALHTKLPEESHGSTQSISVVVLWILFSIYYQENLGMLQAGLGAACSHLSWTVNRHPVDSFSCCLRHVETGPLFCAANGDGGSFLLTPHNRQDQFR